MSESETRSWDELVLGPAASAHYMQSNAWAESRAGSPWRVSRLKPQNGGDLPLQVFSRTVPGLGRLHYAPNVSGVTAETIPALTRRLSGQYFKGLAFKLEIYQPYSEELIQEFTANGWVRGNSVQYRTTVAVDLTGTSEELFARIKKRARYEVRVAERNGVRVEQADTTPENLKRLAKLMAITSQRSGSFIRTEEYSFKYWKAFAQADQGHLYFAWHENDLLAAAFVITFGKKAWYKDGGSVREKSNLMAPRYLQWEIMRDLQPKGITSYDLSGIPSPEELETSSMKGLYTFKTGFANEIVNFMPAMELPLGKRYPLWPKAEPQFLRLYSGVRKDFWY